MIARCGNNSAVETQELSVCVRTVSGSYLLATQSGAFAEIPGEEGEDILKAIDHSFFLFLDGSKEKPQSNPPN